MWNGIANLENRVLKEFSFSRGSIADIVGAIIPYFLAATGAALVIYIIWGGISLILSMGDPKAVAAARSKITTGIIGALVVALAFIIMQLIGNILGIEDFSGLFG